ncbi:14-3-3 superfamily protein [Besnoitia besnoiti]|uniref:14-3-3 superfamily protein n=1 Tax=Besnoitia besnoiti TaxID=94643 RepID=A0A2A9MJ36_BESBE|nr:14-3-3 superfamily protein [Besnoitia besnoiti]PFH35663.1 14-3-3 superfamily protein [Besnoitia besnoiti]
MTNLAPSAAAASPSGALLTPGAPATWHSAASRELSPLVPPSFAPAASAQGAEKPSPLLVPQNVGAERQRHVSFAGTDSDASEASHAGRKELPASQDTSPAADPGGRRKPVTISSDVRVRGDDDGGETPLTHAAQAAQAASATSPHAATLSPLPDSPPPDSPPPLPPPSDSPAPLSPPSVSPASLSPPLRPQPAVEEVATNQAKASIAASLEKWPEVIHAMKELAVFQPRFDATQRELIMQAYSHMVNDFRHMRKTLDAYATALTSLQNSEASPAARSSAPTAASEAGGSAGAQGVDSQGTKGAEAKQRSVETAREAERKRRHGERLACATVGGGLLSPAQLREFEPFFVFSVELYKQRVAEELAVVNEDIDHFVGGTLVPNAEDPEAAAAYEQLRGDTCRHTAAMTKNMDVRRRLEARALKAYEAGMAFAEKGAESKVTALRLGIILNYGVLLKEMENGENPNRAIELVASEFRYAVQNMYQVRNEEEYQRILVILGLLRDNIECWCAESSRTDVHALLGMALSTQLSLQSLEDIAPPA